MYGINFKIGNQKFVLTHVLEAVNSFYGEDASESSFPFPLTVRRRPIDGAYEIVASDGNYISIIPEGESRYVLSDGQSVNLEGLCTAVNRLIRLHAPVIPVKLKKFFVYYDNRWTAVYMQGLDKGCYLTNQSLMLNIIQDRIGLNREGLIFTFGLSDYGNWPYSTKEQIYSILSSINQKVIDKKTEWSFKDDTLNIGCNPYYINETKTKTYFLKGNIELLYSFVGGRKGLADTIENLFGYRLKGIFPELKTKEDMMTLIRYLLEHHS